MKAATNPTSTPASAIRPSVFWLPFGGSAGSTLEVSGADVEAFSNHLMSIFGPREDDVAMIALRRTRG